MNLKGCLFYCFSVNKYSNLLKLNKIVYKMRLIKFIRAVQCQKVIFGYSIEGGGGGGGGGGGEENFNSASFQSLVQNKQVKLNKSQVSAEIH